MKHLARPSCLVAALCLGLPVAGYSHDHHDNHGGSHGDHGSSHGDHDHGHDHGNWHGGNGGHYYYGGHYRGYRPYYYSSFPFFTAPYYGSSYYYSNSYDDDYYDSPSFGVTISPSATYRGTRVDDRAGGLTVDVQRALRRDGYYHGSIDGDIGVGTRGAIRQYQYDHRLEVTGRIDRALLRSLGLE